MRAALALFAKQPDSGSVKTRLSPHLSEQGRVALYTQMLEGTITRLGHMEGIDTYIACAPEGCSESFMRWGLPVFEQRGEGLGRRMENALAHLLSMGYEAAILVGTDIPGLTATHVRDALDKLKLGLCDMVFGPAMDGGYYLLGAKAAHTGMLDNVPWSSQETLSASMEAARARGLTVGLIRGLRDVDTIEDVKALAAEGLLYFPGEAEG